MDMWQDKNDKAHELALLKAQAEITLDQTAIDASIREVESVHQHDSNIKGSLRERVATFYFIFVLILFRFELVISTRSHLSAPRCFDIFHGLSRVCPSPNFNSSPLSVIIME